MLSIFAIVPALAQEVAMGARRGTGARLEAPYTLDVETPHVKWAKPLAGGPIRLLAVPTVREGRTLIELAQRVDLELTTVSIDPAWDTNKWTMGFGRDYGARAERGDLSLIYSYLEAELTSNKHFDAILLPLNHGWQSLSSASQEAIRRRVRDGCGLVLMRPPEDEVSPMFPPPGTSARNRYEVLEPAASPATTWRGTSAHYITSAIPLEVFPSPFLQEYAYRAASDANVIVRSEAGNPILAAKTYGKGRVLAFGFRNAGLSWQMPMSARGFVPDPYWEYFYAWLCRAVIYAAKREPQASAEFTLWRLKTEAGRVEQSGKGKPPEFKLLAPGRHFVEQLGSTDWRIWAIDVPGGIPVEDLRVEPALVAEGGQAIVTFRASKPVPVELIDGFGRVIARSIGTDRVVLNAGRPLTHSGFVIAGTQRVAVRYAAADRGWSDYEIMLPWFGPGSYQPWIPALNEQFRTIGITAVARPERDFRLIASAGLHDVFGVYAYRNQRYAARKAAYAETKDKKHLTRDIVLQSPEFEPDLERQLRARLGELAPLKPLAYYLADESSLTSYTDAFDVDWASEAITGFRTWLQKEYSSLEALNRAWNTSFARWDDVVPMTTEEAQKHGNFAPWSDHRVYMEKDFVRVLRRARDMVRELDPGALSSISGTQVPTAHNGANWYEIDQFMDYLQPYSGGNQDAMHHLFRPGILLTGFTGYGLVGTQAQYQQWQRLFYGHTGASIFWHYTLLNPDLTLSEQGKALAQAFSKLQSGIGRVFMNSRVHEDGVAIHFSMASIRGAWITDGRISPRVGNVLGTSKSYAELAARRDAWVKALERQGVQFRFLATPQIESGELAKYRVLILPYSIAISDREAAEIERFLERGGIVYADDQTGRMDERCRWRTHPLWDSARKGLIRSGPTDLGLKRPLDVDGDFLTTVRDFGSARLIGLLPREHAVVALPPTHVTRYDLLRGGTAAATVEAGPDKPVLLVERRTAIAKLEISPSLQLQLRDADGKAVDRSVARVEVFDPTGRLVRHYSRNVTVVDGTAQFDIPFALSDAKGGWRVRARDVVSGVVAERVVTR
jgi:hypothetical protein